MLGKTQHETVTEARHPGDARPAMRERRRDAPDDGVRPEADALEVVVLCAQEQVRDVIAYWCSGLPVRCEVAEDGYQAGRLLRGPGRRLLITDRVLPPWPGLETLRALRARDPALRIAYVDSGSADDRVLARVSGTTAILHQPLTRTALIDALGDDKTAA